MELFDRLMAMLPIDAASYLLWKAFRDVDGGIKRLSELRDKIVTQQSCRSYLVGVF